MPETEMPSFTTIRLEVSEDHVATITFARPEVRNALNEEMVADIRTALAHLAARETPIACVIFTGGVGEKAFVSGADIGELRDRRHADALRMINSALFREIEKFPAPTIAALNGFTLGGGCELAMACDLRVAARAAKLGQPEVGLGIIPGAGATYRLQRLVGIAKARELIFTGRVISADDALAIGLVNYVVDDEALLEKAGELAAEISKNSTQAVRFAKTLINTANEISIDAAMSLESTSQALLFDSEDKIARMTKFLEKKRKK